MTETAHKMSWDGPYGGSYFVDCTCGWHGFTAADTPETSIKSTFDAHLDSKEKAPKQ